MCCSDATRVFVGGRPWLLISRNVASPLPVVSMACPGLRIEAGGQWAVGSGQRAEERQRQHPALEIRPMASAHAVRVDRQTIYCTVP